MPKAWSNKRARQYEHIKGRSAMSKAELERHLRR
jgi:hypothetical protein